MPVIAQWKFVNIPIAPPEESQYFCYCPHRKVISIPLIAPIESCQYSHCSTGRISIFLLLPPPEGFRIPLIAQKVVNIPTAPPGDPQEGFQNSS